MIPSMNQSSSAAGGIFVPDEISKSLNMLIRDASCVSALAKHIPMKRRVLTLRKQATGVEGYWVDAMAVKEKDAPTFEPYTLTAEKLAVIVPLEDQLIEDADTELTSIITEDVTGAFAGKIDSTLMGYDPTSPFGDSLSGNTPVGNTVAYGAGTDLASDFSQALALLEVNGFDGNIGAITHPGVKHIMRDMRDDNDRPLYHEDLSGAVPRYSFWGVPICFTRNADTQGSPAGAEMLLFYRPYVIIGDRVGLQISRSNEATLTQGTADPINLWEQDMTAFRFVTRLGFVVKDDNALAKITGITW